MRGAALSGACLVLLLASMKPATGRVYMTREQALELAFAQPHEIERRTLYLSAEQAERAAVEAGSPLERRVVPYYVGRLEGRVTGYAYFDTHLVRTLPETILIRVAPDERIVAIDIVSFDEPEDYLPNSRWLKQFVDQRLVDDLSLKGKIRGLTGATLSSRSITQAARRVLALHRLFVAPREKPEPVGETGAP